MQKLGLLQFPLLAFAAESHFTRVILTSGVSQYRNHRPLFAGMLGKITTLPVPAR
jgi:hypothetical protein